MGFAYNGTCYATEPEARAAQCAADFPRTAVQEGVLVSYACEGVEGATLLLARAESAASAASAVGEAIAVTYAPCNELAVFGAAPSVGGFVELWGWGFGLVVLCYVIGLAAKQPLSMIGR